MSNETEKKETSWVRNLKVAYELAKIGYTVRAREICLEIVKDDITAEELEAKLGDLMGLKEALDDLKCRVDLYQR